MPPSNLAVLVLSPATPSASSNRASKLGAVWVMLRAAAIRKGVILGFLTALCACITLAQPTNPVQGPPKIEFEAWREVDRSEFFNEYSVSYTSSITTGIENNDAVRLRVVMPTDTFGPVPVVVLLHYWGARDVSLERTIARRLAGSGIASVIVPLPYHLDRTPPGMFSGEMAIEPDMVKLQNTMWQGVQDVRRAVDWIESRTEFDKTKIGIAGTSLGALVSALAFAVEPRFAASCYLLGGADIAHILWHSSRVVSQREELRRQGYTEGRVRQELAGIEPLNYLVKTDMRPAYVIAAKFDTVVPPSDAEKLIGALGNVQSTWLDTGHYGGALVQNKLVRAVSGFFGQTFRGPGFSAPDSLYAPTIRWGINLNDETGLQVMAGLDVWRLKANGETFAAVMVTPRGGAGFIGHTVSKNFSIGITVLRKRTTLGALWSIVL
jgi:dienelactone hydrolase